MKRGPSTRLPKEPGMQICTDASGIDGKVGAAAYCADKGM
jgi:hypothetical protein